MEEGGLTRELSQRGAKLLMAYAWMVGMSVSASNGLSSGKDWSSCS